MKRVSIERLQFYFKLIWLEIIECLCVSVMKRECVCTCIKYLHWVMRLTTVILFNQCSSDWNLIGLPWALNINWCYVRWQRKDQNETRINFLLQINGSSRINNNNNNKKRILTELHLCSFLAYGHTFQLFNSHVI